MKYFCHVALITLFNWITKCFRSPILHCVVVRSTFYFILFFYNERNMWCWMSVLLNLHFHGNSSQQLTFTKKNNSQVFFFLKEIQWHFWVSPSSRLQYVCLPWLEITNGYWNFQLIRSPATIPNVKMENQIFVHNRCLNMLQAITQISVVVFFHKG